MENPLLKKMEENLLVIKDRLECGRDVFAVGKKIVVKSVGSGSKGRKTESSLKHICTQILTRYHSLVDAEIHLNEFSKQLNVERRRIYDIVNILEGFDIFVKKVKNVYVWKGLHMFLIKLKLLEAIDEEASNKVKLFKFEKSSPVTKKKSLTFLSVRFLKAFCAKNGKMSFKALITKFADNEKEPKEDSAKCGKNKVRRLYDIINVFKALGLISKEENKTGKNSFYWSGSEGLILKLNEVKSPQDRNNSILTTRDINFRKEPFTTENRNQQNLKQVKMPNSGFKICDSCPYSDLLGFKRVMMGKWKENGVLEG